MKNLTLGLRITLVTGIPLLIGLSVFLFLKSYFLNPTEAGNKQKISFMVAPGTAFSKISEQLVEQNFVKHALIPRIIAGLKGIDTRTIKAGEYELSRGMTPPAIIAKLASGDIVKRKVTITEGMTIRDVGRLVAAAGLANEIDFWKTLHDPLLLKRWGVEGDSFEGYLFPNTYFFSLPIKPEEIIYTMMKEGEKIWPDEYTNQANLLNMTRHEVLTLASIIEKESGDVSEQPMISSVFHNRLNKGMKLQADPTVIYGVGEFNGNLTKADLETPTPYNTYTNFGLPPGPIGNPGKNAIHAALYPAKSDYLYFVANATGKHTFSNQLPEHNKAVSELIESGNGQPEKEAKAKMGSPASPLANNTVSLRSTPKAPLISSKEKP
ncbi:MAG: endolytic transglycosylase MltG [SAR324 cluster bacterium]|uniref:Endolytic murein transglycosylase n=1 Tax=SAR324 cluster bacterium TaxID=2024889 RepID=A0A7X9IM58_9DELT|nr:endolytic transglycosylase MltG [SAR324 cluster bacterium]